LGRSGTRIAVLVVGFSAAAALAQQEGPAPIAVDPFLVYPGIDVGFGYDDNLFSSNINKKSSSLLTISPWVRAEARPGPHRFDLSFGYTAGRYGGSSQDNYDDYLLGASMQAILSQRTEVGARLKHNYGHDPRGSTDRPVGDSPDEYTDTGIEGTLGYGAAGARGRLELNGGYTSRIYQTNRESTAPNDHDTGVLGGTLLWRVAPKTQLLIQGEWRPIDYDQQTSTLDSDETRYLVGARWDATALTSGSAKIGVLKKDFRNDERQDVTTSTWEVGARWSPLTYSVFDLNTTRQTEESTGLGDAIVSTRTLLTWTHSWSRRVRTQVVPGWTHDDYRGEGVTREDDTGSLALRLFYQFRRWLRFGVEYTYTDRDSSESVFDYQRNTFTLTLSATL
jgi:hypothetical protein